ncbi:hypothetical protein CONLIGDRAFT_375407 [Coniochaeta ligniaria NRRL 30616]|uniref:Uncharacterized protein n=1 Tax=Coniochaeta ligniaria NRRL 30616 TaxID=1408157 RepID=A0A1J7IM07_9PEZI|nr:hypothetical protein CONLIGDRAFT_375407 [Coniochaeta ligniaria NRRL 30616]
MVENVRNVRPAVTTCWFVAVACRPAYGVKLCGSGSEEVASMPEEKTTGLPVQSVVVGHPRMRVKVLA